MGSLGNNKLYAGWYYTNEYSFAKRHKYEASLLEDSIYVHRIQENLAPFGPINELGALKNEKGSADFRQMVYFSGKLHELNPGGSYIGEVKSIFDANKGKLEQFSLRSLPDETGGYHLTLGPDHDISLVASIWELKNIDGNIQKLHCAQMMPQNKKLIDELNVASKKIANADLINSEHNFCTFRLAYQGKNPLLSPKISDLRTIEWKREVGDTTGDTTLIRIDGEQVWHGQLADSILSNYSIAYPSGFLYKDTSPGIGYDVKDGYLVMVSINSKKGQNGKIAKVSYLSKKGEPDNISVIDEDCFLANPLKPFGDVKGGGNHQVGEDVYERKEH